MTLSQVSLRFGFGKSSAFRLLRTLRELEYVQCLQENNRYIATEKMLALGKYASINLRLHSRARPYLRELRKNTSLTVLLGAVSDREVIIVEKLETPRSPVRSWIGKRLPMHSTGIGKVIMAFMNEEEIEQALRIFGMQRFNANTIVSSERLKQQFQIVRYQGFALENEENELGVRSVAAPVPDQSGRVMSAVSLVGTVQQITSENLANLVELIKSTASDLKAIG
jgi:DNA-binding IclR family transcriptional regulator